MIRGAEIFLMTVKLYCNNIKPESIGILSPYMKQVKHSRNLFVDADVAMPKIGTVEKFQGQQQDFNKKHIGPSPRRSVKMVLVIDSIIKKIYNNKENILHIFFTSLELSDPNY
uniref:AAA_12 domain-containing protein n=1 Tax=Glossina austeni TaxID=7395 RepID=A0A1A9UMF2_GLOAU